MYSKTTPRPSKIRITYYAAEWYGKWKVKHKKYGLITQRKASLMLAFGHPLAGA
jgi:hypothetical protein